MYLINGQVSEYTIYVVYIYAYTPSLPSSIALAKPSAQQMMSGVPEKRKVGIEKFCVFMVCRGRTLRCHRINERSMMEKGV